MHYVQGTCVHSVTVKQVSYLLFCDRYYLLVRKLLLHHSLYCVNWVSPNQMNFATKMKGVKISLHPVNVFSLFMLDRAIWHWISLLFSSIQPFASTGQIQFKQKKKCIYLIYSQINHMNMDIC
jgi:hypothetical protein